MTEEHTTEALAGVVAQLIVALPAGSKRALARRLQLLRRVIRRDTKAPHVEASLVQALRLHALRAPLRGRR
jgi:hypothetical protein